MTKKKIIKKRGVKPGTKRGPYKKAKTVKRPNMISLIDKTLSNAGKYKVGDTLRIKLPNADWSKLQDKATINKDYRVSSIASASNLCGQLEEAIRNLEIRISNSIAKINSLM